MYLMSISRGRGGYVVVFKTQSKIRSNYIFKIKLLCTAIPYIHIYELETAVKNRCTADGILDLVSY